MPPKRDIVRKYIKPGVTLANRYRVEKFIGSGAYGAIFSAIDNTTMERVAVKAIPPRDDGVNTTAHGRFQREMKVISSLRHPNIISLYDFGQTDERIVFMVLEFIDGETLLDVVNRQQMQADEALSVLKQIALALREAHSKGIIHRDLKPQNVMLSPDMRGGWNVKVLDFGMAKVLSRLGDESIIQLTREGVAVGTPRYIAPEQARGKKVGPYTDIYALGLLFYEMFTGARAVKADSIEGAIIAHVSPEPLELDEIEMVPRSVQPLLHRMIEKRLENRYADAVALVQDIERLEGSMRSGARTVPVGEHAIRAPSSEPAESPKPREPSKGEGESNGDGPRSFHSVDELEVDFDRHQRGQTRKRKEIRFARTTANGTRLPLSTVEWVETGVMVLLAFLGFTLLTARFHDMAWGARLMIGFVPLATAFIAAWVRNSMDWRNSPVRYMLAVSMLMLVTAHGLGLPDLALGLIKNGAWFLEPFEGSPGLGEVYDTVYTGCRWYAGKLGEISPEVRRYIINYGG